VYWPNKRAPDAGADDWGLILVATETSGLSGLAGRYAAALYDIAETAGSLDAVANDLRALRRMVDESADLRRLLGSPVLDRADQAKAMRALLQHAQAGDLSLRFVGVITENRRLFALPQIIDAYLRRLAERRGEVVAHVSAAQKLSDAQVERVTDALRRSLGAKVVVELAVDPGLIGGLVVRVGSKLVDDSIRTKLVRLQLAMKGVG
jgi:F-type H+-transporting ATPase subunit delta